MTTTRAKSHRARADDPRTPPLVATYFIRKIGGETIRVCATAFRNITCVSRDRLNRLARFALTTGQQPTERRGGARMTARGAQITESIIYHIKSFTCRESHYGRGKSQRSYLPPELTIKKNVAHVVHRLQRERFTTCIHIQVQNCF